MRATSAGGFLESYDALGNDPAGQAHLLQRWLAGQPGDLFAELRASRPILVPPAGPVLLTRYRDVTEALALPDVFTVQPYGAAIRSVFGDSGFLIGTDDPVEHSHDRALLRLAIGGEDPPSARALAAVAAREQVARAEVCGQLDVANEFAGVIARRMIVAYVGAGAPDARTLSRWCAEIFDACFANLRGEAAVAERGRTAIADFRAWLEAMAARGPGATDAPPVRGRLCALQSASRVRTSADRVRDNLIGVSVALHGNIVRALATVLDVLLDRPGELRAATAAALAGDDAALTRFVREALRLRPPVPILIRMAAADHVIAAGTARATMVPAGSVVFAVAASAMADETELDNPSAFRIGRPAHHYLLFGSGTHSCLGREVSEAVLAAALRPVLERPGLRRSTEPDRPTADGSAPGGLVVEFDAGSAGAAPASSS